MKWILLILKYQKLFFISNIILCIVLYVILIYY